MTIQACDSCVIGEVTYYFADPISENPTVRGTPKVVETWEAISISSCWRGYVGEWRIESGCLYLDAISGKFALADGKPEFADWISGKYELTDIPNGRWNLDGNSTYEILVTEGIVWGFRQLPSNVSSRPIQTEPVSMGAATLYRGRDKVLGTMPEVSIQKQGLIARWLDQPFSKVLRSVSNRSWEDRLKD